jgi:hypothetical protein
MFAFVFALLLFCTAGCSWLSAPVCSEPRLYDLGAQKDLPVLSSVPVEFRSFTDVTGSGVRFLVRDGGGQVRLDAANCFAAPPGQLIRRRLIELFPAAFSDEAVRVSALLSRFECDRQRGAVLLAIDYQLLFSKQRKALRHRIEVKLSKFDGPAIAAALETSVIRSAQRLAGEVMEFKKQCAGIKEEK